MNLNGITISQKKLSFLTSKASEDFLREKYEVENKTDEEISDFLKIPARDVSRLRAIYGIKTLSFRERSKLRDLSLNPEQEDLVYGSLFGDSCIAMQDSGTGYWKCRHSLSQEKYLLHKASVLTPFTRKVTYGERPFVKGGKLFPYVEARTCSLLLFSKYRNLFYPQGEKRLSSTLLQGLTPKRFAYWFLDDGSSTGCGFDITTYDPFFLQEKESAVQIFKQNLGLDVSIKHQGRQGNIHILKNSHNIAWSYINAIVQNLDCFHQKTPFKYRKDNQQPSKIGNDFEGSTTEGSLNPNQVNPEKGMAITPLSLG